MKYRELIIEANEYELLKNVISMSPHRRDLTYRTSVDTFLEELRTAKKVKLEKMPDDVVRMNSTVTIQDSARNIKSYQIVTPEQGDVAKNRISILAPLALALFGYAAEDEVQWQFPSGVQTIKILQVQQNETEKLLQS